LRDYCAIDSGVVKQPWQSYNSDHVSARIAEISQSFSCILQIFFYSEVISTLLKVLPATKIFVAGFLFGDTVSDIAEQDRYAGLESDAIGALPGTEIFAGSGWAYRVIRPGDSRARDYFPDSMNGGGGKFFQTGRLILSPRFIKEISSMHKTCV
jgi:hypothetical protein